MSVAALEKRVRKIEAYLLRGKTDCTCRPGQEINYHTASDLRRILNVACPTHRFRDLGRLLWVPAGTPLLPQDRHLCGCPPNPGRDWLAGTRGPLTEQEQEDECTRWQNEFSEEARQVFKTEQASVAAVLRTYHRREYAKLPK
jgi:hypothetical protein